jgi:hypothetical protein
LGCGPRSLTLWWLLRRHGVAGELRIGVRRDGECIAAHAWVVCHGTVVGETVHDRFVSFESEALAIWVLAFDIDPAPLGATVNLL